jgi:hypothetical protein
METIDPSPSPGHDHRQAVIDRMNEGRRASGLPLLIPRQEHLVREFVADDGTISQADAQVLRSLLASNSA